MGRTAASRGWSALSLARSPPSLTSYADGVLHSLSRCDNISLGILNCTPPLERAVKELSVNSRMRNEMIDITSAVANAVSDAPPDAAMCLIFVPHTTAAVTINENADPDVPRDVLTKLAAVFPQEDAFRHSEGNSDAHIKASLVGPSVIVPLRAGRLALGQWQGIFFCEFDGPRRRQVWISIR